MTLPLRSERGSTLAGFMLGLLACLVLLTGGVFAGLVGLGSRSAADPVNSTPTESENAAVSDPVDTQDADATTTAQPPADQTFADTYKGVAHGVVRLETTTCEGNFTGSGALVAPDLVLTAAHVVDDHAAVQLLLGAQSAQGQVVGYSPEDDTALVRASRPLTGHVFQFVEEPPGEGTEVAAIGFAEAGPLSMAGPGIISTYEESMSLDFGEEELVTIEDVMRTTVPTNQGNSGGPLVDLEGRMVGMVSATAISEGTWQADGTIDLNLIEGFMYAIPAQRAEELVTEWSTTPEPLDPVSCERPADEGVEALVISQEVSTDADAVVQVLDEYFEGINLGEYDRAYQQLSPPRREEETLEEFEAAFGTSFVSNAVVLGTRRSEESEDVLHAIVSFTSQQAPEDGPDGLACVFWTLDYRFVSEGGGNWFIESADPLEGQPRFEACAGER